MYRVSQAMQIALKPPKPWAIAHENGYKTQKTEFLVITLKHVSGLTSHANRPTNPKQWAIAHENDHKTRKRRVFCIPLKHVSGLTSHANRPATRKIWAIAHENGHKTRKLWVFGPTSQTCIGSLKPRKSPYKPETVGNSS